MDRRNANRAARGWLTLAGLLVLVAMLTVAGIRLTADKTAGTPSAAGTATAGGQPAGGKRTAARPVTRTSGVSKVQSDGGNDNVNLRDCPGLPNAGAPPNECQIADHLSNGDTVQMRCWTDQTVPADDHSTGSPRWFYVNEVAGPHPGWSGYVYSAEIPVSQQIRTPLCTTQIISEHQDPAYQPPPPLRFRVVGSCTTAGGTLTAVSANFTPGAQYAITASYPNGNPYPLSYDTGTVSANGTVRWRWPCAGDPPGTYSTTLTDEGDGRQIGPVHFTINPAPSAPASVSQPPSTAPSTAPAPTTPAPTTPAPTTPAPTTPAPATPAPAPSPGSGSPSPRPRPTGTQTTSAPATYTEQEGHLGANTFTDPDNASGMGVKIAPGQHVQVVCRLYDPSIKSASPDGYWYLIASAPWDGRYYAVANTFMNGDPWNGPYRHNTDFKVRSCRDSAAGA